MIKRGQIYRDCDGWMFCTTFVYPAHIAMIYKNGCVKTSTYRRFKNDVEKSRTTFVAEYKTWQEAVNSKEFKDVAED